MYLLKLHCKNLEMYKFHCFQDTLLSNIYRKIVRKNLKQPKMAIPNFSDNFFQIDWNKFRMTTYGHSSFI